MKQSMQLLPQYMASELFLAVAIAIPNTGDDDPFRCTRWDHIIDDHCPFRADGEDGSCTPCRMIELPENGEEALDNEAFKGLLQW